MALYLFRVHDASSELVSVTSEIGDLREARQEAIRQTATALCDHRRDLTVPDDWRTEVIDETGEVVVRLLYP